ncbi:Pyruvate kinase II [gamma proteobacterium HdN1]|nr:Pyruvate kinase II [gamma proteobacterium HdN1]
MRRTKIVATLGPATDKPGTLEAILVAGVNVVRLNFSHGKATDHVRRAEAVREISAKRGLNVAVLADLQGPKIRVGRFKEGAVELVDGRPFILDAEQDKQSGDEHSVGIDYEKLPEDCRVGDILLLDDGRIELTVDRIEGARIFTTVRLGGTLSNNKGINRQGGGLSAPCLTDKDKEDIKTVAQIHADFVAVSFPKTPEDLHQARALLKELNSSANIIAKLERAETVSNQETLDAMIKASDGVMVARGDLGVEIGDAALIGVQKMIIKRARQLNRVVIVATQMMESMIHSPVPTRAEVFDVANAVLDATDAVMLSAETASGSNPIDVIQAMSRVCLGAENLPITRTSRHRMDETFFHTDEAVAMATMYTANHFPQVKAIVCLTESGNTPLLMSRIRSGLPIYALSRNVATQRRTALYRGVEAHYFDYFMLAADDIKRKAIQLLKSKGCLHDGDVIIMTKGSVMGLHGGTNALLILKVGDEV